MMNLHERIYQESKTARERMKSLICQTPLIPFGDTNFNESGRVYLKLENLQKTGSFKLRGAANMIAGLPHEALANGIVTASAGNHAQGVALAAHHRAVSATVFMPKGTPLVKINGTLKYGARVILEGSCYDEAYEAAKRHALVTGGQFVHPFDDERVIAGQGTIAHEIYESLDCVDNIIIPVGGGGLISGMAVVMKYLNPKVRIIGVETRGAMAMTQSIRENRLIKLSDVKTLAEGTAVKTVGRMNYDIARSLVDEMVVVGETDLLEAWYHLMGDYKILTEGAGALSVAALSRASKLNGTTVCLISGGNMDLAKAQVLLSEKEQIDKSQVKCYA